MIRILVIFIKNKKFKQYLANIYVLINWNIPLSIFLMHFTDLLLYEFFSFQYTNTNSKYGILNLIISIFSFIITLAVLFHLIKVIIFIHKVKNNVFKQINYSKERLDVKNLVIYFHHL